MRLKVIIFNIVYIQLHNSISVPSKYFLLHSDKMTEEKKLKSEREFAEWCQTSHAQFPSFLNLFFFNVLFKVLTISYIVLKFDEVTFKVVAEKGVTELWVH